LTTIFLVQGTAKKKGGCVVGRAPRGAKRGGATPNSTINDRCAQGKNQKWGPLKKIGGTTAKERYGRDTGQGGGERGGPPGHVGIRSEPIYLAKKKKKGKGKGGGKDSRKVTRYKKESSKGLQMGLGEKKEGR